MKVKEAEDALRPFEDRERDAGEAENTLLDDPLLVGRTLVGLRAWLHDQHGQTVADLRKIRDHLRALDPDETLSAQLEQANQEAEQAAERHDQARSAVATAEAALEEARRKAADAVPGVPSNQPLQTDLALLTAESYVKTATQGVATAALRVSDAPKDDTPVQDVIPWIKNRQDALAKDREAVEGEQARLRFQWRAAKLKDEPSADGVAEETKRLEDLSHVLDSVDAGRAGLAEALEAWSADARRQELATDLKDLFRRYDLSETASQSDLDALKRKKQEETDTVRKARDLALNVRNVVSSHQDEFIRQSIAPLKAKALAFFEAWSAFPDIRPDLPYKRTHTRPKIEAMIGDNPADLVLSEGQAGALSLSFLLAASTSYRWSRWRALLLDDPLQFTDLVHKAAFLDLLRPLIHEEKYQVIMTSHDLDEADFIRRKCRNASIPFTLCRLLAVGKEGVEYQMS